MGRCGLSQEWIPVEQGGQRSVAACWRRSGGHAAGPARGVRVGLVRNPVTGQLLWLNPCRSWRAPWVEGKAGDLPARGGSSQQGGIERPRW